MNIASVGAQAYERISTGLQINRASDNAAGLSITQGMSSDIKGMEQNGQNIGSMNDLTKTAEGALKGIQENLGRIRELSVQAGSGIMTDSDKSVIQSEISQLMQGIQDTSRHTEFNSMKLLDGSFSDKNTALSPDGTGKQISIESAALDQLGLSGFDVTGSFDISTIDKAIEKVGNSRANLGSVSNAFDHASNNTQNTMANLSSAKSEIEGTDIAKEIMNLKKEQILQQYQMFTQQAKAERERTELGGIQDFKI